MAGLLRQSAYLDYCVLMAKKIILIPGFRIYVTVHNIIDK